MPTRKNARLAAAARLLDERWQETGDELLRLDPDEFRRLLELGEAIIKWYRARADVDAREHQPLLTPRSLLN